MIGGPWDVGRYTGDPPAHWTPNTWPRYVEWPQEYQPWYPPVNPAPTLPGPWKCPDCGTWWSGFEHRCRPFVVTCDTDA